MPRIPCDHIGQTPLKTTLAVGALNERESQRAIKMEAIVVFLQTYWGGDILSFML